MTDSEKSSRNRSDGRRARADLNSPLVENGLRIRGASMTRTETFTDAAFAFAVTLMVVSIDAVPTSLDSLIAAAKGIPAFGLSFLMIMLFWRGHWAWSRRYGLEDLPSVFLSCLLVFVLLCYIYPLKFMVSVFVAWISGWSVTTGVSGAFGVKELYALFAIYGIGFSAMSGVIALLYAHAWRRREALELNAAERVDAKGDIGVWSILAAVGGLSVLLALFWPPSVVPVPGLVYWILPVAIPLFNSRVERRRRECETGTTARE